MNFASAHQKHKTDMIKMEETNKTLEGDLLDAKKHVDFLQGDLADKGDQLTRANIEITSHKDDIKHKTEEVRSSV